MVGNIGILYEDPYILVCRKPAGVPVQSANARVKDMVSILKLYLLEESGKPGEPYLGVVHRLDQPVQGVIVFAKTKQAAANLSSQIADRKGSGQVVKRYCAVVRRNADVYKETETAAQYQEQFFHLIGIHLCCCDFCFRCILQFFFQCIALCLCSAGNTDLRKCFAVLTAFVDRNSCNSSASNDQ